MDEFDLMYADELALLEEAENDFAGLNVRYRYFSYYRPQLPFLYPLCQSYLSLNTCYGVFCLIYRTYGTYCQLYFQVFKFVYNLTLEMCCDISSCDQLFLQQT